MGPVDDHLVQLHGSMHPSHVGLISAQCNVNEKKDANRGVSALKRCSTEVPMLVEVN